MKSSSVTSVILVTTLSPGIAIGLYARDDAVLPEAIASSHQYTGDPSPVKAVEPRDVYYPGTEDLAPNEMRVVALGTGMPTIRPKQAAVTAIADRVNRR